ncbi:MAG: carboxypeptidase M32, partial [Erysipelotrichaceae bacterium]|nr:carboxypeptidase M32 [Erysipelotrichaceae bacterium]
TDELLNKMMGESFNPKYYVDYLKDKYTKLYHLN